MTLLGSINNKERGKESINNGGREEIRESEKEREAEKKRTVKETQKQKNRERDLKTSFVPGIPNAPF